MEQNSQSQYDSTAPEVKALFNLNQPVGTKTRGRPKVNVQWPPETFTFNNLTDTNQTLSSSSLRKKMRAELVQGGLVKVGTLKSTFGRPQNIYQKS